MENYHIVNIIGLSLDILGVVLLFFYEPPKCEKGLLLLESAPSKEDRDKERKTKWKFSRLALIFLIVGFVLQLTSNFL
jgi:hypothetical protein